MCIFNPKVLGVFMRASLLSDARLQKALDAQSLRTLKLMLKEQKINVGFLPSIIFFIILAL